MILFLNTFKFKFQILKYPSFQIFKLKLSKNFNFLIFFIVVILTLYQKVYGNSLSDVLSFLWEVYGSRPVFLSAVYRSSYLSMGNLSEVYEMAYHSTERIICYKSLLKSAILQKQSKIYYQFISFYGKSLSAMGAVLSFYGSRLSAVLSFYGKSIGQLVT